MTNYSYYGTFTKIFDLDPEKVEAFIRHKIYRMYKDGGGVEFDAENLFLAVEWLPSHNEFYVHEEPHLKCNKETNKYTIYKDKELSLPEYFDIQFNHWHFSFQEIYAEMSGENLFLSKVHYCSENPVCDNNVGYRFYFEGKYITVAEVNKGWMLEGEYNEETDTYKWEPVSDELQICIWSNMEAMMLLRDK